jgi:hypothetical protein
VADQIFDVLREQLVRLLMRLELRSLVPSAMPGFA